MRTPWGIAWLVGAGTALAWPTPADIRTRVSLLSTTVTKPWLLAGLFKEEPRLPETSTYSRWPPEPAPQLPMSHPLLRPHFGVQQVHIMQGSRPDVVIVQWAEAAMDATPTSVQYRLAACDESTANKGNGGKWSESHGSSEVYSSMNQYVDKGTYGAYNNPDDWYTSPHMHSVTISGLQPTTEYEYKVAGDDKVRQFRTAPAVGGQAISFALIGDVGQTIHSLHTLSHVYALRDSVDVLLHAGDISYADGLGERWDSYGRMAEFLTETLPSIVTGGNHEFAGTEEWIHYNTRFRNSYRASGSNSPLWHSFEAGPVHVTILCSYTDTSTRSSMYSWLVKDFAAVDRKKTPWLVVLFHTPWYNSNEAHYLESERMRLSLEDTLYDHGVDVVISGHVHSYERVFNVYRNKIDPCGPMYLNIGDGGNREGLATNWTYPQPDWSAFRESSYGSGVLRFTDAESGEWYWYRNEAGRHNVAEGWRITKPKHCPNHKY